MDLSKNKYINIFLNNNQKIKSALIDLLATDPSAFFRNRNNENIDYFKNIISNLEINQDTDYKLKLPATMFEEDDSVTYHIHCSDSNVRIVFFIKYEREKLENSEKNRKLGLDIHLEISNDLNNFSIVNKDGNNFSISKKDYQAFFLFSNNKLINNNEGNDCSIGAFFRAITDDSIINISDFILNNKYTKQELKEKYELLSITYDSKQLPEAYIINIEDYKDDKAKNKITNIQVAYDK